MRLPQGVFYRPRSERLLAKDAEAIVRIDTRAYPLNGPYDITDYDFEQVVRPYLKGDWDDFDKDFSLSPQRRFRLANQSDGVSPVIRSRAEHSGDPDQRQPNLMVIPNLSADKTGDPPETLTVLGSTMGHYHARESEGDRTRQVYEFQSYGLLALDREAGEVELWVARDGDKVAVPAGCHATLYNLGGPDDPPLVMLDVSTPAQNPPSDDLAEHCGPILLVYYDRRDVVFRLNRSYVNNTDHSAGVRLTPAPNALTGREVRIQLGDRLAVGHELYMQLTTRPDVIGQLARLRLRVCVASPETWLVSFREPGVARSLRLSFAAPLVEAARPGTRVHRYFFPVLPPPDIIPPDYRPPRNIAVEEQRRSPPLPIRLRPLNRPLLIVVEGVGDWVRKAYQPVFKTIIQLLIPNPANPVFNLSVVYVGDQRWGNPPKAFIQDLQPWEVFLDKANQRDLQRYRRLVPDVVFVVTPDFTHSEIAQGWIDRTLLICIEKPLDSNVDNAYGLVQALGLSRRSTKILALDHYRFYAQPLRGIFPTVVDHLGGALTRATFYIVEDGEIDAGRLRSLQYGMTLDLLPHFFALLLFFGDLRTVDQICVGKAGQYSPLPRSFEHETASCASLMFEDYSGSGWMVTASTVAGKGFGTRVKFLEILGSNGNAIRIDFGQDPVPHPPGQPVTDPYNCARTLADMRMFASGLYRRGAILFLERPHGEPPNFVLQIEDPYDPSRQLWLRADLGYRPIDRTGYESLVRDLVNGTVNGTTTSFAGTMSLSEGMNVMAALERVWAEVQADRPNWVAYDLNAPSAVSWCTQ